MPQESEPGTEPTTVTGPSTNDDRSDRPHRLDQLLLALGIIAGVVFVIASVFFSGLFVGWSSRSHYGEQRISSDGANNICPMMRHGDEMMGPEGMCPGQPMGPQPAMTTAPTMPHP
ncbi:hypothetical protein PJN19_10750 [Mycobacterium kansasii]